MIKKIKQTFHIPDLRGAKVKLLDQQKKICHVQLEENIAPYRKGEKFLVDNYLLEDNK